MPTLRDKTGMRFGHLRVLSRCPERDKHGKVLWLCECDCGNQGTVTTSNLYKITKCKECANNEQKDSKKKHGGAGTRLYRIFKAMRCRCNNPNSSSYVWYGARGISVCSEWNNENGFEKFREWALNNGYADDLTIERKDHEQGYSPDNCTWIPMGNQSHNTRKSRMFTINGKTQHLAQWARDYNINYQTLHNRIQHGWDIERALGGCK